MRRLPGILMAALVLQGCYTYVPAEAGALSQGSVVRARMAQLTSFDLREITAHNILSVDAELVRATPDTLVVSALWLDAATGGGYPGEGWTVEIPAAAMERLEARRLSWWRTGVVVALGGVATWLGFDALGGSGGGGGRDGGGQTK